jgi:hypothetical protein
LALGGGYALPMMRVWRAVSTTSRLMVVIALISRKRVIWAKRRWTRRKLPPVMRATAAIASALVKSSAASVEPIGAVVLETNASSSRLSGRYSWAKPMREYSCG